MASAVYGTYELELDELTPFESITITPTNAMVRFKSGDLRIFDPDVRNIRLTSKSASVYTEANEALILSPDERLRIVAGRHVSYRFTPVVFKNQYKGFEIVTRPTPAVVSKATPVEIAVTYVALSDNPMEVDSDDVEMRMEDGREWKPYGGLPIAMSPERYALLADTPYPPSETKTFTPIPETDELATDDTPSPSVIASVPAKQLNPEPVAEHTPVIARSEATKQADSRNPSPSRSFPSPCCST